MRFSIYEQNILVLLGKLFVLVGVGKVGAHLLLITISVKTGIKLNSIFKPSATTATCAVNFDIGCTNTDL